MEAFSDLSILEQDDKIRSVFEKEGKRLLNFIRSRIPDPDQAEDLLQDVFYELVESYRLMKPIEQVTSWLFAVTRNRITDFFRKKKSINFSSLSVNRSDDESEDLMLMPDIRAISDLSADGNLFRSFITSAIDEALDDLPENQREVFIMHEIEGIPFSEMAENLGEPVNTLISRKRYAVLYLRERLRELYYELNN